MGASPTYAIPWPEYPDVADGPAAFEATAMFVEAALGTNILPSGVHTHTLDDLSATDLTTVAPGSQDRLTFDTVTGLWVPRTASIPRFATAALRDTGIPLARRVDGMLAWTEDLNMIWQWVTAPPVPAPGQWKQKNLHDRMVGGVSREADLIIPTTLTPITWDTMGGAIEPEYGGQIPGSTTGITISKTGIYWYRLRADVRSTSAYSAPSTVVLAPTKNGVGFTTSSVVVHTGVQVGIVYNHSISLFRAGEKISGTCQRYLGTAATLIYASLYINGPI